MNSKSTRRLIRAKSQEVLDISVGHELERPLSPTGGTGFVSKMKKVLGTTMEKRKAQSLKSLSQGPIFGVPLEDLSQGPSQGRKISLQIPAQNSNYDSDVPHIVKKIIDHIEMHGLHQEGIYRVNGNARVMDNLRMSFDRVGDADLKNKDIYSVGGVLKLFLRQLPVSLIPDKEINEIVRLEEDDKSFHLSELCGILKQMPKSHYCLLKTLCRHLLHVSEHAEENKMTPVSLSIVFGPSVLKCGGGLEGLKKQGSANAAFAKMIQNYSVVFEDDSLPSAKHTELSRERRSESGFKRISRKKPKKPEPYHIHMAAQRLRKDQENPSTSDSDLNNTQGSPERVGNTSLTVDEAIDQAFDAVIREDLEAGARKQRKSENWLASALNSRLKGSFQSDDLTNRVSSPYSWRSSPGTSPSSSPVVSPRTSQVYSTLIGDSIQDNLFDRQTTTTSLSATSSPPPQQQDTSSIISSNPSSTQIPYHRLASSPESSNEQVNDREESQKQEALEKPDVREGGVVLRRNRMSRNRKSAIYGEVNLKQHEKSGSDKKFASVGDLSVHLVTVNDGEQSEERKGSVTSRTGTVAHLAKQFSKEDRMDTNNQKVKETDRKSSDLGNGQEIAREESVRATAVVKSDLTSSTEPHEPIEPVNEKMQPVVISPPSTLVKLQKGNPALYLPPNLVPLHEKQKNTDGDGVGTAVDQTDSRSTDEFDYVTRSSGVLFHPTLQRVRVPFKRKRPSRRSMILRRSQEEKAKTTDSEDKKTESSKDLPGTNKVIITSASPKRIVKQERNVSVSSITSVSTVSRLGSLSSPPEITPDSSPIHTKPQVTTFMQMETIVDNELDGEEEMAEDVHGGGGGGKTHVLKAGIAPEDKPIFAKAWAKGDSGSTDLGLPGLPDLKRDTLSEEDLKDMNYEEMLRIAHELKATIEQFENDFFTKYGRKPSEKERYQWRGQIHSLDLLKKKLKATGTRLSKTVPTSVGKRVKIKSDEVQEGLASFSATKLDETSPSLEKKATVHRHQSLLVHTSQEKNPEGKRSDNSLVSVRRKILSLLSERRARANRPEELSEMTHEQLMEEKQAVQKILLHFERKHGRPQTSEDKDIMRPVYDRYRNIKRLISSNESRKKTTADLSSTEVFSSTQNDSTLGSISILHSSLVQSLPTASTAPDSRTALFKTPLASLTPSSFVLPLSPSQPSSTTEHTQSDSSAKRPSYLSPAHNTFSSLSSTGAGGSVKSQSTSVQPLAKTSNRGFGNSISASAVVRGGTNSGISIEELKKASASELNNQLRLATAKKKQIGKELRQFERGFEESHGRPLQKEDKKLKCDQYVEYRMLRARISEINELLSARLSVRNTTQQ